MDTYGVTWNMIQEEQTAVINDHCSYMMSE